MKLIKTFFIGLATISLVGCSSYGKEVSKENFVEAAQKLENKEYSKATVTYMSSSKTTGYKAAFDMDDEDTKISGKITLTSDETGYYELDGGQGAVDEEIAFYIEEYVGLNIKDSLEDIMDNEGSGSEKIKFYTGPLGVYTELKLDGSDASSEVSGYTKITGYIGFDVYGYVTKFNSKTESKMTSKIGNKSITYTSKYVTELTISYQ